MRILMLLAILGQVGPRSGVEIVAHRGASDEAPENTLSAFRLGYEQAGTRFQIQLDAWMIGLRDAEGEVRAITPADADLITSLYRTRAAASAGMLDRGDYVWHRIREPRGDAARAFLVERAGRPEGDLCVLVASCTYRVEHLAWSTAVAAAAVAARAVAATAIAAGVARAAAACATLCAA